VEWGPLGVHPPITRLSDGTDLRADVDRGRMPAYVPRDRDTQLRQTLHEMTAPAPPVPVRLVLLVGDSAAGKSRTAVEAMRAELADWQLLIPAGPGSIKELLDHNFDLANTVIWLDEHY
jgi:hypothetical protein